jgi:hypothetical protein
VLDIERGEVEKLETTVVTDARARLLRAALGFALVPNEPELRVLHRWLDCWRGIGDVVVRMARQGWDLQLTEYDAERWRATFFASSSDQLRAKYAE